MILRFEYQSKNQNATATTGNSQDDNSKESFCRKIILPFPSSSDPRASARSAPSAFPSAAADNATKTTDWHKPQTLRFHVIFISPLSTFDGSTFDF